MINRLSSMTLAVICSLVWGCESTPVQPNVFVTRHTTQSFAITSDVEVLQQTPARPFTQIAELKVGSGTNEPVLALIEKAKALGANAIILTGEVNEGNVTIPTRRMVFNVPQVYRTALAIRYK